MKPANSPVALPRSTLDATPLSPEPRRVLVRGVNWLGDAVMTLPALERLRERFPRADITLLTPDKLADLWVEHPSVDEVMTFGAGEGVRSVASRIRSWQARKRAAKLGEEFRGVRRLLLAEMAGVALTQLAALRGGGQQNADLERARQRLERQREVLAAYSASPFDLALVLPNSARSALEVWLGRVPQRLGYTGRGRNWLLTRALAPRAGRVVMRQRSAREVRRLVSAPPGPAAPAGAHQIHEYLHLVAALGGNPEPVAPRLEVKPAEVEGAVSRLKTELQTTRTGAPAVVLEQEARAGSRPWFILAVNPGAEYGPAKRWPAASFAAAIREVSARLGPCVWLAFGGAKDVALCDEIAQAAGGGVVNLAGRTSLRELMALLKICRVLLTNDSGPMHLAAALGTPVVAPFGSTAPELTGPGLPGDGRHCLLQVRPGCAPCFRRACPIDLRCLTGIEPGRAAEAVAQRCVAGQ